MDVLNRIKYDAETGLWRVLHEGKDIGKAFKNSAEAFAHLQNLIRPGVAKS